MVSWSFLNLSFDSSVSIKKLDTMCSNFVILEINPTIDSLKYSIILYFNFFLHIFFIESNFVQNIIGH